MNGVQLCLNEKVFSEIQIEVKDGILTRFEGILKVLNDEKINDSIIKENAKFCYKCIKLLPFVTEKLPRDLVAKTVSICAKKGVFKKVKTEKNFGFDCIKGKKNKTIKVDRDLFTLRNAK